MTNLEKWVNDHKKELEEAYKYRKRLAKHVLCPIEDLFFTLVTALISDVEDGCVQPCHASHAPEKPKTVLIGTASGVTNNLTTADQTIDQLKERLRRLEMKAGKDRYRRTPVSEIPISLPVYNSDALLHNMNVSEDELPRTRIEKGLSVRKVTLQDGTYINLNNAEFECTDPNEPNIGILHHEICQWIASREDGSVKDVHDVLTGMVDFSKGTIQLSSSSGIITSAVFSGILFIENI